MGNMSRRDVDAIRFAVLRRLAPGLRHRVMGELQSLQFSGELAARLIDVGGEPTKLALAVRQVVPHAQAAAAACTALIEWLRADEGATTAVDAALPELARLVGDDWVLRGIECSTDAHAGDAQVARIALREVVVTALLALTDAQTGPLDIGLTAERAGNEVVIRLTASPASRASLVPELARGDKIDCADVAALAAAHGVACACVRDGVTVRLPVPTLATDAMVGGVA